MTNQPNTTRNAVILFVLLVFGISTPFYVLLARQGAVATSGAASLLTIGLMWSPAAAALITRAVLKIKEPGMGWRVTSPRYLLIGFLLPVLYGLAAYAFLWLTGLAPFQNAFSPTLIIFVLVGSITGNLTTLGEEIGWRGFLVPQVFARFGFTAAALISGVVWALWHFPVLLTTSYNRGGLGAYSLAMFLVSVIAMSFIYAWLRLKSNSVWPAVLMHTSHNVFILHFFEPLTVQTPQSAYWAGETGAALVIVSVFLALIFWRLGQRLNPQVGAAAPAAAQTPLSLK